MVKNVQTLPMFFVIETNFTSVQNSSGHTSYKTFNVRRAGHVNVTVTTCDIAMLKLIANNDEMTFITVQVRAILYKSFTITIRREFIKRMPGVDKNNCEGYITACYKNVTV